MKAEEFNQLQKKYLRGQATPEEEKMLEEWLDAQPGVSFPDINEKEKKKLERRIWSQIRSGMTPARSLWSYILAGSGIAACLVSAILWAVNTARPDLSENFSKTSAQERFEIKNTTGSDQEIVLSDSTLIILRKNSGLTYTEEFNHDKREVFLEGEAFFQVKRDVMKPFVVHAGELATEVLGTSFLIKQSKENKTTEVAVTSGKVSVYARRKAGKTERNGVILTANQQVSYNQDTHHITTGIVKDPVPGFKDSDAAKPPLDFRGVPLEQVLNALTRDYGIEFVIANPNVKHCGITADLSGLSMFTQLELICKSIDAEYERRGTVVFIHGEGC